MLACVRAHTHRGCSHPRTPHYPQLHHHPGRAGICMQTMCMQRSADPSLSPYTHVSPACPVGSSPLYNHILYGLKPGIICPRYKAKALIPVYRNALSFSPLLQNPNPETLHFPKTCGSYFVLMPSFLPQSASQTTFRIS